MYVRTCVCARVQLTLGDVSAPKFGIASLSRAIVGALVPTVVALSLYLSLVSSLILQFPFSVFVSLSLSLSLPLSVPVLVYGNTSGISEFGSAFKELEEHYPLARPAQPVWVAHGRVETRARPTDKFLTTLHLGATGAGCMCDESVVLHVQQFVGFLALLAHHECIVRLMRERERGIDRERTRERGRRN